MTTLLISVLSDFSSGFFGSGINVSSSVSLDLVTAFSIVTGAVSFGFVIAGGGGALPFFAI